MAHSEWAASRPCSNCPFLKEGGIRLTKGRSREIVSGLFRDLQFHCHKTVERDAEEEPFPRHGERHCAGALIFMEKHRHENQMMRIMYRIGCYDPRSMQAHWPLVFDSLKEMQATALDRRVKRGA